MPSEADTRARIRRLRTAIGDGPHATSINTDEVLRGVLEMLDDREALALLAKQGKAR